MLQPLVNAAQLFVQNLTQAMRRRYDRPHTHQPHSNGRARNLLPLRRVVLTDEVGRTLFEEFAEHQAGARGEDETGWLLLGYRREDEAVVLATLPAGTQCNAGVAHVHFNSLGQVIGSRIVRQRDRRLTTLGVVHTHPGSMRHPSDADLRGDRRWVAQLRGQEGVFGIGTADGPTERNGFVSDQPRPHVQTWGALAFSWYVLREEERQYRTIPVEVMFGPDLARPLHSVWTTIEAHAEALERLAKQQAGLVFDLATGPALMVTVPLAEPESAIRILLEGDQVRYILLRNGEALLANMEEPRIDHAVYLLLAELASKS